MAQIQIPLANAQSSVQHAPKSANRDRFMKASGLDVVEQDDPKGVQALFNTMRGLVEAKHRQIAVRENVRPDKEVKEPFTFDSMKREVIQNALDDIHRNAPPDVRAWLDHWQRRGSGRGNRHWAIEWFLYNRFRHTDYRNRPKPETAAHNRPARPGSISSSSTLGGGDSSQSLQTDSAIPTPPASPSAGSDSDSSTQPTSPSSFQRSVYDPVRDKHVGVIIDALAEARS